MGDFVLRNASEYAVIKDRSVTLRVGGDIDITFDYILPAKVRTDEMQVVSFFLISSKNAWFTITVNGVEVHSHKYVNGGERSVVDAVLPVSRSGPNRMTFELGNGKIEFADVILWYKRDAVVTKPIDRPRLPGRRFRKVPPETL